jgi:hypothetical protein
VCTVGVTLAEAWESIGKQVETVAKLNELASKHPYYKYNSMWSREMQSIVGVSAKWNRKFSLTSIRAWLSFSGVGSRMMESCSRSRGWESYFMVRSDSTAAYKTADLRKQSLSASRNRTPFT